MVVGGRRLPYKSICRDNRSRRAYDDSPRDDDGVARNGFGGGGGGGGGAAPEYWGGRRTDRDVDWPDVTRDSASAAAVSSLSRRRAASRRCA